MGNMFVFYRQEAEAFCNNRDIEESEKLIPGLLDFKKWV